MFNKIIKIFLMFLFFKDQMVTADEIDRPFENCKKYDFSICAIFKNEALYLKEWIEYHRVLGVDHFYLYNIGSRDFFQIVLDPYIKQGIVTLVNWPEMLNPQDNFNEICALITKIPAYENAINFLARGETKWLIFVDVNEYVVSPLKKIKELLIKYDDYPAISLASNFYNSSTHHVPRRKIENIESLQLVPSSKESIEKSIVKMIFKPDQCIGFNWPPYQCCFKDYQSSISLDQGEVSIIRWNNINIQDTLFDKKIELSDVVQYNALSETEAAALWEDGYMLEKQDLPMYKKVPEFLKKLGNE